MGRNMMQFVTGIGLLLVAIIAINIIANRFYQRVDVTADAVYSLSDGTYSLLEEIDQPINAKLYFSRSMKELPVPIKTYASRVEEVLREYSAHSNGQIIVEAIDPRPDTDDEEWARKYGINGVRLPRGEQMYFGLVFLQGDREIAIPYFDPRREEFLEYDLSESLVRLANTEKSNIGILSPLPIAGNPQMGQQDWVVVADLKRHFNVQALDIEVDQIDPALKVVIVVHPSDLPPKTAYALDQYLLQGGRLIVAVDPMSRIDLSIRGQQARMAGQMPKMSSNLDKLFAAWGVQYNDEKMIGDLRLATRINAGGVNVAYPMFVSISAEQLSNESVITAGLKQMLIAEGGHFSLSENSELKLAPLITTTADAGEANASMAAFMMPSDLAKEVKAEGKELTVAGLLTGTFKSAYPGGSPGGQQPEGLVHRDVGAAEGSVIIVADTDFLADGNSVERMRFGSQTMVRVRNDNLNFLFNATDFLGGSQDLISIRTRGRIARPFTRVAELQREAQERWKDEEERLTNELRDLQQKLNDLQKERTDGNRFVLTPEQQKEIAGFREKERQVRKRRREVRKNLREEIESLGRVLIALNMLLVPGVTAGFGVAMMMRRGRRAQRRRADQIA